MTLPTVASDDWKYHPAALRELSFGTPLRMLSSGKTRSAVWLLEDANGRQGEWVLKAPSRCADGIRAIANEIVGSWLCAHFGIGTPTAGYIIVPSKLALPEDRKLAAYTEDLTSQNAGKTCYCSEFLRAPLLQADALERSHDLSVLEDAVTMYCMDRCFGNSDRSRRNPNALLFRKRIFAIDHELMFHGAHAIDDNGLRRETATAEPRSAGDPHLAESIALRRGSKPLLRRFRERMARLTPSDIGAIETSWLKPLLSHCSDDYAASVRDLCSFLARSSAHAEGFLTRVENAQRHR